MCRLNVSVKTTWFPGRSRLYREDLTTLTYLAQQMHIWEATLEELKYESDVDSSETIKTILIELSLPHIKWTEAAATIIRQNRQPLCSGAVMTVEKCADVACERYGEIPSKTNSETHGKGWNA
ncbi:hypothetical protein AHF37_01812 [Paragonimus kellicotti]|nr:hypothetical protein AHF37_01812 [Paragonimus kellicotti]